MVLFIWNWIREYYNFVKHHEMFGGYDTYSFPSIMQIMAITSVFRIAIFSLLVGFGILIRRKIGWIFITAYLYLLVANTIMLRWEDANTSEWKSWVFSFGGVTVVCLLIIVMNRSNVVREFHKITQENRTRLNLKALGVGLIFFFLLLVWKNYMLQQYL